MRRHAKASSSASSTGSAGRVRWILLAFAVCAATVLLGAAFALASAPQVALSTGPSNSRVHGTVAPEGKVTSWKVQYITDALFQQNQTNSLPPFEGATNAATGSTAASGLAPVEARLPALSPATTYHLRLLAENADGTNEASTSFTTGTQAPGVVTGPPRPKFIGYDHASLFGDLDPHGEQAAFWFEYGPADCASGPCASAPAGQDASVYSGSAGPQPGPVVYRLGSLEPSTTYHYRLVAETAVGISKGADQTFTTDPEPEAGPECSNEGPRAEQHATFLPDCRAYELVSPPAKHGGDVLPISARSFAAVDGGATTFASLLSFGDSPGAAVSAEHMSERTATPGTQGWATHPITPPLDPPSLATILSESAYREFSPDLSTGIFRSWSPLTADPEVANVGNLYARHDLRSSGDGTSSLVSACPACAGTPLTANLFDLVSGDAMPKPAGASADFHHIFFESKFNLTGDGSGPNKLYASDDGAVRLIGLVPEGEEPTCGGTAPACVLPEGGGSTAGLGASNVYTQRVISDDGSRVNFTAPMPLSAASSLYQRDSHGTASIADDTTVRLDLSERDVPDEKRRTLYQTASTDGRRVFLTAGALTDDVPGGETRHLYMYDFEHQNNEVQKLKVEAGAGQFRLLLGAEETADIPFDATPAQLESALEALPSVSGAGGQIAVSGGPGDETGSTPYTIAFEGGLAEKDEPTMTTAAGTTPLSGGAGTATVSPWIKGGGHLTLIDRDAEPADGSDHAIGAIGASEDGHYLYFISNSQLVAGAPPLAFGIATGIYLWHDGEIRFVGSSSGELLKNTLANTQEGLRFGELRSRVTPDGHSLLFMNLGGEGAGLTGFDQTPTNPDDCQFGIGCSEFYLYNADADTLACVSCSRVAEKAGGDADVFSDAENGAAAHGSHLAHALSDDGRRVFFNSTDALLSRDTNGKLDVYEYDAETQKISLISSGTSKTNSYLMDASADGSDVFFTTRERLVGWDAPDVSGDLYDARVAGGLPEPVTTVECSGESCRPAPPAPPALRPAASASLTGKGNPRPRCPKGTKAKKTRGKTRCVKRQKKSAKHRHQSKRTANSDRRTAR